MEPAVTCDEDKDKHAESYVKHAEAYMSGVELVWTERGERLHMSRECVSLRSSTNLRSKSICRLCARDHK